MTTVAPTNQSVKIEPGQAYVLEYPLRPEQIEEFGRVNLKWTPENLRRVAAKITEFRKGDAPLFNYDTLELHIDEKVNGSRITQFFNMISRTLYKAFNPNIFISAIQKLYDMRYDININNLQENELELKKYREYITVETYLKFGFGMGYLEEIKQYYETGKKAFTRKAFTLCDIEQLFYKIVEKNSLDPWSTLFWNRPKLKLFFESIQSLPDQTPVIYDKERLALIPLPGDREVRLDEKVAAVEAIRTVCQVLKLLKLASETDSIEIKENNKIKEHLNLFEVHTDRLKKLIEYQIEYYAQNDHEKLGSLWRATLEQFEKKIITSTPIELLKKYYSLKDRAITLRDEGFCASITRQEDMSSEEKKNKEEMIKNKFKGMKPEEKLPDPNLVELTESIKSQLQIDPDEVKTKSKEKRNSTHIENKHKEKENKLKRQLSQRLPHVDCEEVLKDKKVQKLIRHSSEKSFWKERDKKIDEERKNKVKTAEDADKDTLYTKLKKMKTLEFDLLEEDTQPSWDDTPEVNEKSPAPIKGKNVSNLFKKVVQTFQVHIYE